MIRFSLEDKTPREEDVYSISWAKHLGEDTLALTLVPAEILDGSITVGDISHDVPSSTTSFWVRGGVAGEVCRFIMSVNTVGGRKLDALCVIGVRK